MATKAVDAAKLNPFEAFKLWQANNRKIADLTKANKALKERFESEFASNQRTLLGKIGRVGYRIVRTLKQRAGYEVKACEYWTYELQPVE